MLQYGQYTNTHKQPKQEKRSRGLKSALVEEVMAHDRAPGGVPGPRLQRQARVLHMDRAANMVVPATACHPFNPPSTHNLTLARESSIQCAMYQLWSVCTVCLYTRHEPVIELELKMEMDDQGSPYSNARALGVGHSMT